MLTNYDLTRRDLLKTTLGVGLVALGGRIATATAADTSALPLSGEAGGAAFPKLNGQPDESFWGKVREQFDLLPGLAFLNNGTLGPVPHSVSSVHERVDRELYRDPRNSFRQGDIDAVREKIAALINADPDEITLTHSTTEGINIFGHGLDLRAGDEVILGTQEHAAAFNAYAGIEKRFGVKVVKVQIPVTPQNAAQVIEAYEKAITPRTRLIVVSHVSYSSGLVAPVKELAELAHRRGLLISVDAAQSFGVIPLDIKALGVDHYAAPGQKWLLAGTGTGFSYFKKDIQDRVWPLTGFYDPASTAPHANSARRYEHTGQINVSAALGIGAAVDFHKAIGPANIEKRDRELSTQLRNGLAKINGVKLYTSADPALSSALTVFSIRGLTPEETVKALQDRYQVFIRTINTGEIVGVRASTHFYNTHDEVERLLAAAKKLAG